MRQTDPETVAAVARLVLEELGARVEAIYHFGLAFAQGPRGPAIRLLVLVDAMDLAVLERARALRDQMREQDATLRLDTQANLQASTDVFPVLTFELINSKVLLEGEDVLGELELHPRELRLGIEHSLRATHRDLLRAWLDDVEPRPRAIELRRAARRVAMMLEATLVVAGHAVPDPPGVEAVLDACAGAGLLPGELETWHGLCRFGDYEEALPPGELEALHGQVLVALLELVRIVDQLEPAAA